MIQSYSKNNNFLLSWPSTHSIFVNSSSNSKSKYNFSSLLSGNWDDNMNFETAKKVVDTIFFTSSKKITIEFQWWEPLMNWDVLKYII